MTGYNNIHFFKFLLNPALENMINLNRYLMPEKLCHLLLLAGFFEECYLTGE